MKDSITIITITRHRPRLLQRAIASVKVQTYHNVQHLIIIDDCTETQDDLMSLALPQKQFQVCYLSRTPDEASGPARLAKLRNYAANKAASRWISFLDDDNEFLPNHIESLVKCALDTGLRAVHSYMQLVTREGNPYLEERLPWARDLAEGQREYERLRAKGIFIPGSHISHDRIDPLESIDPVRTVDTGEWLFERELLLEYPFPTNYSDDDWQSMTTEDDKLIEVLVNNGINVSCTKKATLKYYLGGYSNTFQFE